MVYLDPCTGNYAFNLVLFPDRFWLDFGPNIYLYLRAASEQGRDFARVKLVQTLSSFHTDRSKTVLQGPAVQSVVSLKSSLAVKMLTVLVSTISNSQVFLLKKM